MQNNKERFFGRLIYPDDIVSHEIFSLVVVMTLAWKPAVNHQGTFDCPSMVRRG